MDNDNNSSNINNNINNNESSEAYQIVREIVKKIETEKKESEALQKKIEKANLIEENDKLAIQESQNEINQIKETLGNITGLNRFCNNTRIDQSVVAKNLNALADDYSPEVIKEFVEYLEDNSKDYFIDNFDGNRGREKFTRKMTKDIEKFIRDKEKVEEMQTPKETSVKKTQNRIERSNQPSELSDSKESIGYENLSYNSGRSRREIYRQQFEFARNKKK